MHCNRLLGRDRSAEVFAMLAKALRDLLVAPVLPQNGSTR
jgi:hypothetical protein